jgi:hypothetical protein
MANTVRCPVKFDFFPMGLDAVQWYWREAF